MTQPQAILCIDIDGTLINEEGVIHPDDIEIMRDFPQFIQPILTTGRNINTVKKILKSNDLHKETKLELPCVLMNGGLSFLPGEKLCTKDIFTTNTLSELINIAKETKEKAFAFYTREDVLLVNPNNFALEKLDFLFEEPKACDPHGIPDEIFKVIIFTQDPHAPDPIKPGAKHLDLEIVYSLPFAYEINPPGINKANTLKSLINSLGIDSLSIYTIGDADNDLSLFALSTLSFAPSSAQSAVLKHADHIIYRDQHGLFSTILKHIEFL